MTIIEQGSGPAPQAAPDLIKETTTQTFVKDVIEESKRQPVLIDFWAPWCGPCRQLTPIIEKAVRAAKGKVKLVKMNIDEHPAIPGQMGIQSIPAVIAFFDGQPVDGFMGALPESQVTEFLGRLTKGTRVYVEGRIRINKWTGKDGTENAGLSVAASLVQPLGQIGQRKPTPQRAAQKPTTRPAAPVSDVADFDDTRDGLSYL